MKKFKPGDKVICVEDSHDGSFFGHPGERFTISSVESDGNDIRFVEMDTKDPFVRSDRFRLDCKEEAEDDCSSELQSLIRRANEGLAAEHLLLTKYTKNVQRTHSDFSASHTGPRKWFDFSHNPYDGYSVYREKPKPVFESFYVGPAETCDNQDCTDNPGHKPWKVYLKKDLLHIEIDGDKLTYAFKAIDLISALEDLTKDSSSAYRVSGYSLDCRRNGIIIDYKYQISWEDAEAILVALEKWSNP